MNESQAAVFSSSMHWKMKFRSRCGPHFFYKRLWAPTKACKSDFRISTIEKLFLSLLLPFCFYFFALPVFISNWKILNICREAESFQRLHYTAAAVSSQCSGINIYVCRVFFLHVSSAFILQEFLPSLFFSCPFIVVVLAIVVRLKWSGKDEHIFSAWMSVMIPDWTEWRSRGIKFSFSPARVSWPIFPTLQNLPWATAASVDSEHYRLSAAKWIMNAIDWIVRARPVVDTTWRVMLTHNARRRTLASKMHFPFAHLWWHAAYLQFGG